VFISVTRVHSKFKKMENEYNKGEKKRKKGKDKNEQKSVRMIMMKRIQKK
jgi:hypothetical protein